MTTSRDSSDTPPVDLLWVFAHPDDETYSAAGTMAWAADRGLRTAYLCATRGEAGEIRDSRLGTPDSLGAVREHELRRAMSITRLSELRMLGFRDSGMEGTPENDDPRALIQQPEAALVAHLVGHLRDLRPAAVITFGPEGVYGHPDHILVGRLTERAIELAADDGYLPELYSPWRVVSLYHSVVPREFMLQLASQPDQPLGELTDRARQNLGTPVDQITHWFDVSPWLDIKRDALAAHATQVDADEMLSPDTSSEFMEGLATEQLARRPLPWDPPATADDPIAQAHSEIGRPAPAIEPAS